MREILNIFQWLVLGVVLAIAGAVVLSTFDTPLGVRVFNVQSGSMEPAIHLGSLVFIRPQDAYQKDDIITVRSERTAKETVTHRITEVVEDEGKSYRIKGDANEDADSELVSENRVVGRVIFSAPYLGYPVGFAQTQIGFVVLIIIPATIIIYSEAMNIKKELAKVFSGKRKEKDDEEN